MSEARRVSSCPAGSRPLSRAQSFFQVTQGFSFSKSVLGAFFWRWSPQASQLLIFFASLNETIPGAAAPARAGIAATSASAPTCFIHFVAMCILPVYLISHWRISSATSKSVSG